MARRVETFARRQRPKVFSAEEFASVGFFLPKQRRQDNVEDVRVACWYCGLELDRWAVGGELEEEHLHETRTWKRKAGVQVGVDCPGSTSV